MQAKKLKQQAAQHYSNLAFLYGTIRNGGPMGHLEGQRFNFLLHRYRHHIRRFAIILNLPYYEEVLRPWIDHPERIPKHICRHSLPIPCTPTQEDRFWAATLDPVFASHAMQWIGKGYNRERILAEIESWSWLC